MFRSPWLTAGLVFAALANARAACVATGSGIVNDGWCNMNCIATNGGGPDSCNDLCQCDGSDGEAVTTGCTAVSCTATAPATDSWCLAACCAGACDSSLCSCVDSNGNAVTFANTVTITQYYSVCPTLSDRYCTDSCAIGSCQTQCCKTMPANGVTPTPEPFTSVCPDVTDEYCTSACNTIHAVGPLNPGCSRRCCRGSGIYAATVFYSLCDTLTDMWCTENCAAGYCVDPPIIGCCTDVADVEVFYDAVDIQHATNTQDGNFVTTNSYCKEACLMTSTTQFSQNSQVFGTCAIDDCQATPYYTINGVASSDANLKRHIVLLGMSLLSVPVYTFQYTHEWCASSGCDADATYVGTMAQDLIGMGREDAIVSIDGGYMGVDYSRLDVPFGRIA